MVTSKVFICYAGEDRERFVLPFARRLRDGCEDIAVELWEMNPDDSLVNRIFNREFDDFSTVVIVISAHTVVTRWMREELNAWAILHLKIKCRIMPIVIDGCAVPEALRPEIRVKIADTSQYDQEFRRAVWVFSTEYNRPDNGFILLKAACDLAIESGSLTLSAAELQPVCEEFRITEEEFCDCLKSLSTRYHVTLISTEEGSLPAFEITAPSLLLYTNLYCPDFSKVRDAVIRLLANGDRRDGKQIADALEQPLGIVLVILRLLARYGWIRLSDRSDGSIRVDEIGAKLTEWVKRKS